MSTGTELYNDDLVDDSATLTEHPVSTKPSIFVVHTGTGQLRILATIYPADGAGPPVDALSPYFPSVTGGKGFVWCPPEFDYPFFEMVLVLTAYGDCSGAVVYSSEA